MPQPAGVRYTAGFLVGIIARYGLNTTAYAWEIAKAYHSTEAMSKRRFNWSSGDVFGVPLADGRLAIGQVLDLMMPNAVRVCLYKEVVPPGTALDLSPLCQLEHLISLVTSTREQLDYGAWRILDNKPPVVPNDRYPNEQFRSCGWVGAKIYDAAIIEEFLNAFHALLPWDDWFDPNYLDSLLVDISQKPKNLILTKS